MEIVIANTKKEIIDHFYVRGMVFVVEQGIDYEIEFDGKDVNSVLFVTYMNGQAVGAARLYQNKVGRLATIKKYRQKGVASSLMDAIEQYAKDNRFQSLVLHAQLYVKDFYIKRGYKVEGEVFQEAGIDHIKMIKHMI